MAAAQHHGGVWWLVGSHTKQIGKRRESHGVMSAHASRLEIDEPLLVCAVLLVALSCVA